MSCEAVDSDVKQGGGNQEEFDNFTNDSGKMVAWERHLESIRPDAMFNDPFAKVLAGSNGEKLSAEFGRLGCKAFSMPDWHEFHKVWTAVRTRFIDDHIKNYAKDHKQMLNLGAGVDTRPYRMDCYKSFTDGIVPFDS